MSSLPAFILCYVDPGSTGFIVQVIIGAIVGAGFFFKTTWWRLRSFVSSLFSKKEKKQ